MLSTISRAGCPAASMALRTAGDVASDAGGGLVVHDAHRLDRMLRVGAQALLDHVGLHAAAPARFDARHARNSGSSPSRMRHLVPQRREVAGLVHQHRVARAQRR